MKHDSGLIKAVCLICIALAAHAYTHEICVALSFGDTPAADSTDVQALVDSTAAESRASEMTHVELPFSAESDPLMQANLSKGQPIYRKWWFWAVCTAAATTAAILLTAGEEKQAEEDLPGFPDPPERR